jgi:hypothetical protein
MPAWQLRLLMLDGSEGACCRNSGIQVHRTTASGPLTSRSWLGVYPLAPVLKDTCFSAEGSSTPKDEAAAAADSLPEGGVRCFLSPPPPAAAAAAGAPPGAFAALLVRNTPGGLLLLLLWTSPCKLPSGCPVSVGFFGQNTCACDHMMVDIPP